MHLLLFFVYTDISGKYFTAKHKQDMFQVIRKHRVKNGDENEPGCHGSSSVDSSFIIIIFFVDKDHYAVMIV